MKKLLIAGGAGFVGREILKQLSTAELNDTLVVDFDEFRTLQTAELFHVTTEVADISDPILLDSLVKKYGIKEIIHLAANSDIRAGQVSAAPDFDNTLKTSLAIAEVLSMNSIENVLFASSSAVFGEQPEPIAASKNVLRSPTSNYGWAKLASEHAFNAVKNANDFHLIVIRFPNVIGGAPTHGVLFDLKNKLKQDPNTLDVLGDGTQSKPYMHVEDLVKVILRLFKSDHSRTVNIGPGDNISVADIVDIVIEVTGLNPKIRLGNTPHGWVGDVNKYEFEDDLPSDCSDILVRNSRQSVIDAFTSWWAL